MQGRAEPIPDSPPVPISERQAEDVSAARVIPETQIVSALRPIPGTQVEGFEDSYDETEFASGTTAAARTVTDIPLDSILEPDPARTDAVPFPADDALPPEPLFPSTIVEAEPVSSPPEPADFGNDTIAAPFPIDRSATIEFFPQDLAGPPATLPEQKPVALPARPGKSPQTAVLLVGLLLVVALLGGGAYLVLTRFRASAPAPQPPRATPRQQIPTPSPAPIAPEPVPVPTATTATAPPPSLETQGPPPPETKTGPAEPVEETKKKTGPARTNRSSKKSTPAPAPEPVPEPEPAPVEPEPVDPMAVVEPGPGVTEPDVVYTAPLRLPFRARLMRVRGRATVEVIVKTDGTPESPVLIESSGNETFDRAAINAAMRCRFAPAIRNGERVRMRKRIDYTNMSTRQE